MSTRAQEIFERLGGVPATERGTMLDRACGADAALRAEVESLLRAHDEMGGFLGTPTARPMSADDLPTNGAGAAGDDGQTTDLAGGVSAAVSARRVPGEGVGTRIGPYKLLQQIGEGGFGSVFMAEQEKPVARRVALKIIKLGMDTRQVIARFEAERQALAMMDHPNIAKVLDAGATETGRPFFVMELVKGEPITTFCDHGKLTIDERLDLFAQVCAAVQHAHTKGIIHRDIKPSNVLVSAQDGRPSARVIDFGIAKATQSKLTEKTLFTEHKQLIGTPEYMSPEQAAGSLDIDTRTDVYSLGVLLYELLTGSTPFSGKELRSAAYDEIQRIIREVDPPAPSTRLSQSAETIAGVAASRRCEPKKLGVLVRGELDWIVMKALEKDRQRRYETANGLGADIRRYLRGEAVVAAPPGAGYRLKKFVRRNRGRVIAGGIVAGAMVIATGVSVWFGMSEARQRAEADKQRVLAEANAAAEVRARARAEAINRFVTRALEASDPMQRGRRDTTIAEAMTNAIRELESGAFTSEPETEAALRDTIGLILKNNGAYARARPLLEQGLAIRERVLPADSTAVALSLDNVGQIEIAQGRYAQAEPLLKRSLAIFEKARGPEHADVASVLNSLGQVYHLQHRSAEAETMFARSLAIREKLLGPDHRDVAISLNDLALEYSAQQKFDRAEELLKRSLAINEKTLGPDHPDVAACLNSLALLYEDQGEVAKAEPLYARALAICEKALGPDHPIVATALHSLAELYRSTREYARAEPVYTRALAIREKALGPDHPDVAIVLNNLAMLYKAQGRYAEAEPLYQRTLRIDETVLGPGDPEVATDLHNLATLYREQGQHERAEPVFVRAVEIFRKSSPAGHPTAPITLTNLARTRQALGKTAEARQSFDEAMAMLRRTSPEGSPTLARVLWLSASARLENKDARAALPELEAAVAMGEKVLPADHPHLKEYRQTLGACREMIGADAGK